MDTEQNRLSPTVRHHLADEANEFYVSVVSVWEMQIKIQIGKLTYTTPLNEVINLQQMENNLAVLPVTLDHAFKVGDLQLHHQDPFDRLIIAQAIVENMTILSKDQQCSQYPVSVIW